VNRYAHTKTLLTRLLELRRGPAGLARLLGLLCVMLAAPVVEAGVADVIFTGHDVRYTLYTLNDGAYEYIQLHNVAEIFRLTVEVEPGDGRVVLRNQDRAASFFPGQGTVIADRRSYFVDAPPRVINGVVMVPLEFLTQILPLIYDGDIFWDPARRAFHVGVQELEISRLYVTPYGDYTRIVVEMNTTAAYTVTEKLPSRLLIDLPYSKLELEQSTIEVSNPAVDYVRVINSFGTTQMTVRLGHDFEQYRHAIMEDPPRLVLDVYHTLAPPAATAPVEGVEVGGILETDLTAETAPGLAAPPRKAFSLQTVVIDPGHGGSDPGIVRATAQPPLVEKDLTLQVATMLAHSVQQRFGQIRVVLTREGDSFVGAEDRATIANHNLADVFLSLHVNNSPSSSVSGFEVYIMDYGSLDLPAGFEHLPAQSQVLDYAQAPSLDRSRRLAQAILDAYQARVNQAGSLKSAPLFTLKGATMPAVHIELGYGSNAQDVQNLAQPAFQERLVAAITDGIAAFRKSEQGE
jgi:N-acetylmuramoyl-L-alanine amidase